MVKRVTIGLIFVCGAAIFAQQQSPEEQLQAAIYANDGAKIKAAVKAGANANGYVYGSHYLGLAATGNYDKSVRALVESGADVNYATSSGGWTALMGAADQGNLEIVKYLVSKKADVNAKTRQGRTALIRSAYHGRAAVIAFLLGKGANVNAVDNMGVSALMLAAQMGFDQTVKVLLDAGADKNLKTTTQKTALQLATEAQTASGAYRAEEYKNTIALLTATKKTNGKLIGKVFSADGRTVVIRGENIHNLKKGSRLVIKTASGEISATVKETLHSKVKATAAKAGAAKGDSVYLAK